MKKILQIIAIFGCTILVQPYHARATIHNVEVADFQFTPTTFIANVGDTIHWFWMGGSHTTTSMVIPLNAQSWDQLMTSASPAFDYVITVAGNYNYVCTPHASMGMTGNFTAVNATSIQENVAPVLSITKYYVKDNQLNFDYSIPVVTGISFELFDVLGQKAYAEKIINQSAGVHSHIIDVANMPKGIYILRLYTLNNRLTKRLIIE